MFEMRPYRRNSMSTWNPFSEMEEMERRLFNNDFFSGRGLAEKKGKYVCCERSYGAYSRSFDVSGIRAEGITASYDSGVLTLKLPKKTVEVSSSRQISID